MDASEFAWTGLGDRPEVLNAIDMVTALSELILGMFHTIMLLIAEVHQTVMVLNPSL